MTTSLKSLLEPFEMLFGAGMIAGVMLCIFFLYGFNGIVTFSWCVFWGAVVLITVVSVYWITGGHK